MIPHRTTSKQFPGDRVAGNIMHSQDTACTPEMRASREMMFTHLSRPEQQGLLGGAQVKKGNSGVSIDSCSQGSDSTDIHENKSSFFCCMYGNIMRMQLLFIREPVFNLLTFLLPILGIVSLKPVLVHSGLWYNPNNNFESSYRRTKYEVSTMSTGKSGGQALGQTVYVFVMGPFLLFAVHVTKRIVLEKEMQLRELMSIMGLSEIVRYTSWVTVYAVNCGVMSLVCACLCKLTCLRGTNYFYISSLFFLFTMSLTSLFGLVAAFFESVFAVSIFSCLGYLVLFFVGIHVDNSYVDNILSTSRFTNTIGVLLASEASSLSTTESNSLINLVNKACLVLFLQFSAYLLLMIYFDAVLPREWGLRKNPLFFILDPIRAYSSLARRAVLDNNREDGRYPNGVYEPMQNEKSYSVRIVGLTKVFKHGGKKFRAVNSLHWALHEGEISVLLGHNGSGKTTLMNMMIGMLNAGDGDCHIYGYSVRNDVSRVRETMGYCPQKSILWPNLTCREHLRFYARIRGLCGVQCEAAIEKMLMSVDLKEKGNHLAGHLSGGQKRKLSVLIAFVAGTRFVMLDEPTAGVDALARRQLWDLARSMAPQRTILLSTHFMDEADMLGDSVAIIKKGRLCCAGSSMFLKSRLGVGYVLTVPLQPERDYRRLVDLVNSYEPKAKICSRIQDELSFDLPMSVRKALPQLLADIEDYGEELGTASGYSVNSTTLEQIFLRVMESEDDFYTNNALVIQEETQVVDCELQEASIEGTLSDVLNAKLLHSEFSITISQLKAMLQKRFLNNLRCWRIIILQFIIPIVFMLIIGVLYELYGPSQYKLESWEYRELGMVWSLNISIVFTLLLLFMPSTFISPIVKERVGKTQHMQKVSGICFSIYWFSNFFFDLLSYIVSITTMVIVLAIFGVEGYLPPDGMLVMTWLFFGMSSIAMTYVFSFFFKSQFTAHSVILAFSLILSIAAIVLLYLSLMIEDSLTLAVTRWILRLFPVSCVTENVTLILFLSYDTPVKVFTDKQIILINNLFMVLETVAFFLITFILDNPNALHCLTCRLHLRPYALETVSLEADVLKEQEEVVGSPERSNDPVRAQHLYKLFSNGNLAVCDLTFGIKPGEVLALLGVNGSGKTTSISMLCQDLRPTKGRISICGYDTVSQSKKALQSLGYCPQFDATFEELTVEEHLWLYAGVRSIDYAMRHRAVESLIALCDLTSYRKVKAAKLSGGNQRKLSLAISLLGNPQVLLLDEPSAGLDPVARHRLWVLIKAVRNRCAVLLTTHHLEEVEMLAHRVAIMVRGTLKCIGTKTHLKEKYGSGFQIKVRVEKETGALEGTVVDFFEQTFPSCSLNERHGRYHTYDLPADTKLSLVFRHLEENMDRLGITDYAVSPKTIEEVFMRISGSSL